jgi:hypothetical protein
MDHASKAAEVLNQCEKSLRDLLGKAAESGDYASVVKIASWAKAVSDLTGGPKNGAPAKTEAARKPAAAAEKKGGNNYPRFFRQGDALVKIAWSKRQKGEYQHKAPFAVLMALADAVANAGQDGRIFSTDDFLPITADGGEVPSYQSYLGLALLRQVGLVDQHGRQGYSIPRLPEFKDAIAAVWKKLPTQ